MTELLGKKFFRQIDLVLVAWLIGCLLVFFTNVTVIYAAGNGGIYTISDCTELQVLDDGELSGDSTYILTNDIDCDGIIFEPLMNTTDPFAGTFDGRGYAIRNLTIEPGITQTGLFAETAGGAVIKNLTLSNGSVTGSDSYTGGLVGFAEGTSITNVHSNLAVIGGTETGGLVGELYSGAYTPSAIQDSSVSGSVSGLQYTGGLAGFVSTFEGEVSIQRSFATGDVTQAEDGQYQLGGLVGLLYSTSQTLERPAHAIIEDSYAQGDVTASNQLGGLVGNVEAYSEADEAGATATVRRSYASGSISGAAIFGGLVGYAYAGQNDADTVILSDNFSAATIAPQEDAQFYGAFMGSTGISGGDYDVVLSNNLYAENLSEFNASCTSVFVAAEDCSAVADEADFQGNSTHAPFHDGEEQRWDFDSVWFTVIADYPALTPVVVTNTISLISAENGAAISIEQSGCSNIENTSTFKEGSLSVQDVAYNFPLGLIGFRLAGCPTGGTAMVSVTFSGMFDPDKVLARKYNPDSNGFTTIAQASKSVTTLGGDSALKITYTIIDGGELDQDGVANGVIVDPVGLAQQVLGVPNTGLGVAEAY